MKHFFTMKEDYQLIKYYIENKDMFTLKNIIFHLSNKLNIDYEKIRHRFRKYLTKLTDEDINFILEKGENNDNYLHFYKEKEALTIKIVSDIKVFKNIKDLNKLNEKKEDIKKSKIMKLNKIKKKKYSTNKNKILNNFINEINNNNNIDNNSETLATFLKIYIDKIDNIEKKENVINKLNNPKISTLEELLK